MTKSISTIAPLAVIAASLVLASPALAQSQPQSQAQAQAQRPGEQLGMRYLSWGGKPAGTTNDGLRRASASAASTAASGPVQTVSLAVPTAAPTPSPARPNRYGSVSGAGLTPASAWIKPRAAPAQPYAPPAPELQAAQAPQAYAPQPQPQPQPQPISEPQPRPQAVAEAPHAAPIRAVRQDPYSAAPPEVQMAMHPTPQPVPAPSATPTPAVAEAPADPMAPRRDALIFRMGGQAPAAPQQQDASPGSEAPRQLAQAAPPRSDAPARQGARYYSVHREAGHQPDPMILPESVFIGGSADLAEPPPAPVVQRTVKGQAQVVVPNQDPSLP